MPSKRSNKCCNTNRRLSCLTGPCDYKCTCRAASRSMAFCCFCFSWHVTCNSRTGSVLVCTNLEPGWITSRIYVTFHIYIKKEKDKIVSSSLCLSLQFQITITDSRNFNFIFLVFFRNNKWIKSTKAVYGRSINSSAWLFIGFLMQQKIHK